MEDLCRMCLKKCLSKKAVDSTVAAALDDIFHIKVCFLFIFLFHTETLLKLLNKL